MTLDIQGDDDMGYEELGARRRRRGPRGMAMMLPRRGAGPGRGRQLVTPDQAGAPSRRLGLYPAAFPIVTFALADGTNTKSVNMNVQTAFKGQRFFATIVPNGASALLTTPLISQLLIGMTPAIVTPDGVPLQMFNSSAFDMNILFPPTEPGVLYQLSLRLPVALAGADTILVVAGVLGTAWQ